MPIVRADFSEAATALDLILGEPDGSTAIAVGEQEAGKGPVRTHWFPNTRQGRADAYALADRLSASGRNTFLSPCLWDAEVLGRERPPNLSKRNDDSPKFARAQGPWIDQDHQPADPSLWNKLVRGGAVLTRTRGQHLRIPLDEPITDPADVERWNKHLARRLGADTSKCHIASWLTFPGSLRFKLPDEEKGDPGYPDGLRVRVVRVSGGSRSTGALEALAGTPQARQVSEVDTDGLMPADEVPARALRLRAAVEPKARYSMIADLIHRCREAGHSQAVTLAVLLEFEPLQDKCADEGTNALERGRYHIKRLWEKEKTPDASHTEGSHKESATKRSTTDDTQTDGDVVRLRRLDELDEVPPEEIALGLYEGLVSVLVGNEASAKTTTQLHICAAVATGKGWEPFDIEPGDPQRVALICTEPAQVGTRLHLLGVPLDTEYVRVFSDQAGSGHPTFPDESRMDELAEYDPALVIVDVWSDTVGAGISLRDAQQGRAAMMPWVRFGRGTGAAVLLIAHTNRSNGEAMEARDIYGLTGALRNTARATLFAFRHPETEHLWIGVDKTNQSDQWNARVFSLRSVETGRTNKRGQAVTVPQLQYESTEQGKVWDHYKIAREANREDKDVGRMTTETALRIALADGEMTRRDAIQKTREIMGMVGMRPPTDSAVDKAWTQIKDSGDARAVRYEGRQSIWGAVKV